MNRLHALEALGVSVWLDYIRRGILDDGTLRRLIEDDGVSGITANPSIFEKAIGGSTDYDSAIARFDADHPGATAEQVYEHLAVEDLRAAADLLRPTYERTHRDGGYVSLEVSPAYAHDTARTIDEAKRLRDAVGRPNLFIKVPATPEGIPAIEALTAEGVNVNVTLMFSPAHYEAVSGAYLRGLERAHDPAAVRSVASFFVSRVDTKVDVRLAASGERGARELAGRAGIANCRTVYERFLERFEGPKFAALRAQGAVPQKLLWASTGVKDARYRDTMYVEELIGPSTINTMPPALIDAFRDHGVARGRTIRAGSDPDEVLSALAVYGIDLDRVGDELSEEGIAAFEKSFRQLFAAIEEKRRRPPTAGRTDPEHESLGSYAAVVGHRRAAWESERAGERLWRPDPAFWPAARPSSPANGLGWLHAPEVARDHLAEIDAFAHEVRSDGFSDVVLLGMGGSSLAGRVLGSTVAPNGGPRFHVLDSTHPAAVREVRDAIEPRRTLFLVASKSGETLEAKLLFRYFWAGTERLGLDAGRQFVAITDPGTALERTARERKFRRTFRAPPTVGGRYSALTPFGLVPAALAGVDVAELVERGARMAEACAACVPASQNPGLRLGSALGELARAGRNKLLFLTSPSLEAFPLWAEQLLAESLGKDGHGVVPVVGDPAPFEGVDAADRSLVAVRLPSDPTPPWAPDLERAEERGVPVLRFDLADLADLGQEFFRWEFAVAAAGSVMGVDPFDQPDVELAKEMARRAMRGEPASGRPPQLPVTLPASSDALREALRHWTAMVSPGAYVAIQAYLAPDVANARALARLREALRERLQLPVTLGYGPSFLHSTGQLHKGGPDGGLFLQLLDAPLEDLPVPGNGSTFGGVIRAQAEGDASALAAKGRPPLRVDVGSDAVAGLTELEVAVRG